MSPWGHMNSREFKPVLGLSQRRSRKQLVPPIFLRPPMAWPGYRYMKMLKLYQNFKFSGGFAPDPQFLYITKKQMKNTISFNQN